MAPAGRSGRGAGADGRRRVLTRPAGKSEEGGVAGVGDERRRVVTRPLGSGGRASGSGEGAGLGGLGAGAGAGAGGLGAGARSSSGPATAGCSPVPRRRRNKASATPARAATSSQAHQLPTRLGADRGCSGAASVACGRGKGGETGAMVGGPRPTAICSAGGTRACGEAVVTAGAARRSSALSASVASRAGACSVVDTGCCSSWGAGRAGCARSRAGAGVGAGSSAGAGEVRVPGRAKSRSCSGPTVPSRGGGAGVTTLAGAVCAAALGTVLNSSRRERRQRRVGTRGNALDDR